MFRKNTLEKTIKKGHEYLEKREFLKAKDMYLKALAHDPDNVSLLNNLAQLHLLLGDPSKAKGYNEILLEKCDEYLKHEKTEELLIFKANAMVSLNKENEAIEVIDDLLKINPNNMIGLFHKSHYFEKNGIHTEALKYLERILKENPHSIAALLSKGRNLVELMRFDGLSSISIINL